MELLEKTLDLYHSLSTVASDAPPNLSKVEKLKALSHQQILKVLNKPLSEPDPQLMEKMCEYKSRLNTDKVTYSRILAELEKLEYLNHQIEKSQLLLKSFKSLSPDLNLARIQLAERLSSINN